METSKILFSNSQTRNIGNNHNHFFWERILEVKNNVHALSKTFRRLMSYIYGAPILDVSRSHTTTQQSVGLLWTSDQLVAETST